MFAIGSTELRQSLSGGARTFGGIAPPLSVRNEVVPTWCSDGRLPPVYVPFLSNFFMLSLYSVSTLRLSAFGCGVGDIHQTRVKASFTRVRRTVTHSAGDGSRAGLKQTNSWHRCSPAASWNASNALIAAVDTVGVPGTQPFPSSSTIDPSGASMSASGFANPASQPGKASATSLPYFFFRASGKGGDVKTSWT